jgi:aspartate/methionine/tyrosine aminotransferase
MFPRLDPKVYPIADDQQFAYELLQEKVLIVQGTGFNWPRPTTSASSSCRTKTTCARPSAASPEVPGKLPQASPDALQHE